MVRHPFDVCATKYCCFCCYFESDVTCYIIASLCIIVNAFCGLTNFGILHWSLYLMSILNFVLHLGAGVVLFIGALWNSYKLKLAYCWLALIGICTVVTALALYFTLHKHRYIIWGSECHNFNEVFGTIIVIFHSVWLGVFDLYTSMIVLGNTDCDNLYCGEDPNTSNVTEADFGLALTGSGFLLKVFKLHMEETDEDKIVHLYSQGKWQEIIDNFNKNRYLPWVWPEKKNFEFIGEAVQSRKLKSIISIGCGSGLLEWLLSSVTGMEVIGVEIDGTWWKSKYSSRTFIPLTLVEDSKKGELAIDTENSALLFCYFNNLEAFLNYVGNFKGRCFIVIGPGRGRGTYTVPEPFCLPGDLSETWRLSDHQQIRSSLDFIAVYDRK